MIKLVTWNNFEIASISKAERKKARLENAGYTLISETRNSLTYKLNNEVTK